MYWQVNIIGNGAIGAICAAGAHNAGIAYRRIVRPEHPKVLHVESIGKRIIQLANARSELSILNDQDLLILPLKVYQLANAMEQWADRLSENTPVVLLHNGMGGRELARDFFPNNPVFLATTSHGALKINANRVQHTGEGNTMLGMAFDHPKKDVIKAQITSLMCACVGPVSWRDDMETALWQKLLINCAINPLTALANVKNGALATIEYRPTLQAICEEVCLTAQACGIDIDVNSALENVLTVVQQTAENYSSMHQDIVNNRQSEIDALNGYVVNQAQKKGIDVPVNTRMWKAIKAL